MYAGIKGNFWHYCETFFINNFSVCPSYKVGNVTVVYIINCVWATVLQECRSSFGKNRLQPGIQSAVDGKRLGLKPFKNKLRVPRKWGLHFIHGGDQLDQKTADRRLFSFIIIVDKTIKFFYCDVITVPC